MPLALVSEYSLTSICPEDDCEIPTLGKFRGSTRGLRPVAIRTQSTLETVETSPEARCTVFLSPEAVMDDTATSEASCMKVGVSYLEMRSDDCGIDIQSGTTSAAEQGTESTRFH